MRAQEIAAWHRGAVPGRLGIFTQSVALFDIERLSYYNYLYGHVQADELIERIGAIVATSHPGPGVLSCRRAGALFAVYCIGRDPAIARRIADAVRTRVIDAQFEMDYSKETGMAMRFDETKYMTVAAGICSVATQQLSDHRMLEALAAVRLQQAKRRGPGQIEQVAIPFDSKRITIEDYVAMLLS